MYSFGLLGCGNISCRHAENIKRTGSLVALCRLVPARVNKPAAQFNRKAYYIIRDLIESGHRIGPLASMEGNGSLRKTTGTIATIQIIETIYAAPQEA